MKAHNLKPGHVLVDPEGHLYEVVAVNTRGDGVIHAWLWPDSSPVPNYWQEFNVGDDIVSINGSNTPAPSDAQTEVIPVVPVTNGTPE